MAEPASIELSNVALGDPRKKLRQVALRCLARLTKKELISEVVFQSIQEILNSDSIEETILVIQIINEAIGNHSFEIEDKLVRKLDDLLITSTNNTLLEEATNCISNIILERKRQNRPMDDEYVLENIYQIRLSLEAPETDYQNSISISTCKKMIPEISRLDEHATKEILELLITQSHHTRALELICYIVWTNTHLADKDFTERIWNILGATTRYIIYEIT